MPSISSSSDSSDPSGYHDTGAVDVASAKVLAAARLISQGTNAERGRGLTLLRSGVEEGSNPDVRDTNGLRAMDMIATGNDSVEAAAAIECMAEAGHADAMMRAPSVSGMPPMMAAAFTGNPCIVEKFLELGMPADTKANAPREKLLGGTAFHATVLGYRENRKDDFASVMRLLISYAPNGIDISDRLRQKPIDMAMKAAAITGDRTLSDAMMQFGVEMRGAGEGGADKVAKTLIERDRTDTLRSLVAGNEARAVLRSLDLDGVKLRP